MNSVLLLEWNSTIVAWEFASKVIFSLPRKIKKSFSRHFAFVIMESSAPYWASLVAHTIKHLPTMWKTRVQSLGWEDCLEKEMATHSSILAWKIPWMEEPGRLQSMGSQRVGHD